MIDLVRQTPYEYSVKSRDYQVLARLFTALYNINKMYADNMSIWDANIDNKLSMLRSKTLNFDPNHSWNLDDLDSAVSCFKYLMRLKGTNIALKYCLTILMRMRGLTGDLPDDWVSEEGNTVIVKIPQRLTSAGVVEDLFSYLIPAGMTYRIIEYREFSLGGNNNTALDYWGVAEHTTIANDNLAVSGNANETNTTLYKNAVYTGEIESEIGG